MIVIVVIVVTGGKQSQLLALALGLGWSLTIYSPTLIFMHIRSKNIAGVIVFVISILKHKEYKTNKTGSLKSNSNLVWF